MSEEIRPPHRPSRRAAQSAVIKGTKAQRQARAALGRNLLMLTTESWVTSALREAVRGRGIIWSRIWRCRSARRR